MLTCTFDHILAGVRVNFGGDLDGCVSQEFACDVERYARTLSICAERVAQLVGPAGRQLLGNG